MSTEVFEQIEINIEQARELVAQGEALDRLRANPDFVALITEGYFVDEAVRLVQLKAAPGTQRPELQAAILTSIDAIGNLQQYFSKVFTQAETAKDGIAADQDMLAELAQEGEL